MDEDFFIPILKIIEEMGGEAHVNDILPKVEADMRNILKPVDYELIPSGKDIRWRKKANRARYYMVEKGLLSSDSPRGVWSITQKGKDYLRRKSS